MFFLSYLHTRLPYSASCGVFVCVLRTGHVPAEDPHYSAVFCLHAGEEAGLLSVALAALPHGWSHSSAGRH